MLSKPSTWLKLSPTGHIGCGSSGGAKGGRRFGSACSCMMFLERGAMASPGPETWPLFVGGTPQTPHVPSCGRSSSGSMSSRQKF
eukprot:scaffold26341_cov14-Tisochrysis_lutea.AAC.2